MANLNDWLVPLLTFLGTVFAGAGLKWIEGWLRKAKDKDDVATNLRNELRTELTALKAEIQANEKELDDWKKKYFEVLQELLVMRVQLQEARRMLAVHGQQLPSIEIPKEALTGETPV